MHRETLFFKSHIQSIICENCVEKRSEEIVAHRRLTAEQVCRVLSAHLSVTLKRLHTKRVVVVERASVLRES